MLLIKKAQTEDLLEISAMDMSLAINVNNGLQVTDSTQAWLNWIDNRHVLKATNGSGNLAGVIVYLPINNRGYCIHKLLISDNKRTDFIFSALIERFLIKVDKQENKAHVIIHPNDLEAIALYSTFGFNKQTMHPNYLGINEDRLIMSRPLKWSDIKTNNNVLPISKLSESLEKKQQTTHQDDENLFLKSMNIDNYRVV